MPRYCDATIILVVLAGPAAGPPWQAQAWPLMLAWHRGPHGGRGGGPGRGRGRSTEPPRQAAAAATRISDSMTRIIIVTVTAWRVASASGPGPAHPGRRRAGPGDSGSDSAGAGRADAARAARPGQTPRLQHTVVHWQQLPPGPAILVATFVTRDPGPAHWQSRRA